MRENPSGKWDLKIQMKNPSGKFWETNSGPNRLRTEPIQHPFYSAERKKSNIRNEVARMCNHKCNTHCDWHKTHKQFNCLHSLCSVSCKLCWLVDEKRCRSNIFQTQILSGFVSAISFRKSHRFTNGKIPWRITMWKSFRRIARIISINSVVI